MISSALIDLNGNYISDADDSVTGVVPFYADQAGDAEPKTLEPVGYTVGVPLTVTGLYKPKFDLSAWQTYQDAIYDAQEAYIAALDEWQAKGRIVEDQPVYTAPAQPGDLWQEGLTPEEIAELTQPSAPSEGDKLRQRLKDLELVITELMLGN
ncbi:hypothetical protein [Paenibacillus polymyxa]|uniref:Uncharacterized protein n=1 Tax=Paenibacillus polymyxa TaxID=1406 RepID=A0AAP4EDU9_PAEPO|nr:hypothetical protein [Paenibacillus polymyxa]MDH2334296.1 hypothetical protein [Paenibacillus polymyxa]